MVHPLFVSPAIEIVMATHNLKSYSSVKVTFCKPGCDTRGLAGGKVEYRQCLSSEQGLEHFHLVI